MGDVQTDSSALVKVRAATYTPQIPLGGPGGTRVPSMPRDTPGRGEGGWSEAGKRRRF